MGVKLNLGPHFDAFLKSQIESGRYESEDDVLRAGLRLLEAEERRQVDPREALAALFEEAEADFDAGRTHALEAAFASLEERYRAGAKRRG